MIYSSDGVSVGDHVQDKFDNTEGIVVKIIPGQDVEEHGTIFVWQLNRTEYGIDNCEHYCHFGWRNVLKVLKQRKT